MRIIFEEHEIKVESGMYKVRDNYVNALQYADYAEATIKGEIYVLKDRTTGFTGWKIDE